MTLHLELALVTKLKALGQPVLNVFSGDTYPSDRKPKVRAACLAVRDVLFKIENGKHVTIAMMFARVYGEAL